MDERAVLTDLMAQADRVWREADAAMLAGRSEEYRALVSEYYALVEQAGPLMTPFPWRFIDGSPVPTDYQATVSVMVGEAARAVELFGDDELEAYAAGQRPTWNR